MDRSTQNYLSGFAVGLIVSGAIAGSVAVSANRESRESDYITVQASQARVDLYPISNISTMRVERTGPNEWGVEADVYSVGSPGWKPVILFAGTYDECMEYVGSIVEAKEAIIVD